MKEEEEEEEDFGSDEEEGEEEDEEEAESERMASSSSASSSSTSSSTSTSIGKFGKKHCEEGQGEEEKRVRGKGGEGGECEGGGVGGRRRIEWTILTLCGTSNKGNTK